MSDLECVWRARFRFSSLLDKIMTGIRIIAKMNSRIVKIATGNSCVVEDGGAGLGFGVGVEDEFEEDEDEFEEGAGEGEGVGF